MEIKKSQDGKSAVAVYTRQDAWEVLKQLQKLDSSAAMKEVNFCDNDTTGELESIEITIKPEDAFELLFTLSEQLKAAPVEYGYSSSGKERKQRVSKTTDLFIKQQNQYNDISDRAKTANKNGKVITINQDEYEFLTKLFAKTLEYKVRGTPSSLLQSAMEQYEKANKIEKAKAETEDEGKEAPKTPKKAVPEKQADLVGQA